MKSKLKKYWKLFKCFYYRIIPLKKRLCFDISNFDQDVEILERYQFADENIRGVFLYVGKNKFIKINNEKYFRYSVFNEKKSAIKSGRKVRNFFDKRWYFYFGNNQEVNLQGVSGWPSSIMFQIDWASDNNLSLNFWFIFKWYISIKKLPKFFMNWFKSKLPRYQYSREISISIHHWSIWWIFWADSDSWSNKDSKWRKGSFSILDFIRGKESITKKLIGYEEGTLFFREGGYDVVSIKSRYERRYKRFGFLFNKDRTHFNVSGGKFIPVNKLSDLDSYRIALIEDEELNFKKIFLIEKKSVNKHNEDFEEESKLKLCDIKKIEKNGDVVLESKEIVRWGRIKFIIKETGIPTPDCKYGGDDAIYSMGTTAENFYDSFGKMQSAVMKYRRKDGGSNWVPAEFREQEQYN